jgi:DNA-binding transcriptional regulator YhcF (GntR family)
VSPDLSVDRASEVPLGTQLAWKLRTAIATGLLAPGERLPGVRELAATAEVNVNTVRTVYSRLEDQGLVASEHGRGTFVAAGAQRRESLAGLTEAVAEQARAAGVDPRELAAALFVGDADPAPEEPAPPGPARGEALPVEGTPPERGAAPGDEPARRRALRADIAQLERELVHLARLGDAAAMPSATAGRILTASELDEIRTALVARLAELRRDREDALHRRTEDGEPVPAADRRYRDAGVWTGPASRVAWTS